jgi:hypothetical protein
VWTTLCLLRVPAFHHTIGLADLGSGEALTTRQEIHILELPNLGLADVRREGSSLLRWARFLLAKRQDEIDDLAREDTTMADAARKLQTLTSSNEFISLATRHEHALRWQQINAARDCEAARAEGVEVGHAEGHAVGHAEGHAEGLAEGRRRGISGGRSSALIEVLSARFGELAPELRERIATGTDAEPSTWLRATARAERLEEVFPPTG